MKKIFYILLLLLLLPICVYAEEIPSNNLKNVTKSSAIKLDVTKVKEIPVSSGMSAAQGIEVTDKYLIITQNPLENEGTSTNDILVYDKNTLEYVKTIKHDIGHGNDICYNTDTNELLFVRVYSGQVSLVVFDADTLTYKKDISIDSSIMTSSFGITYNPNKKQYFLGTGATGYIFDKNFQLVKKFDIAVNQTRQSWEFSSGYLYYSVAEPTNASYDRKFDAHDGVIYTFDETGTFKKALYIPHMGSDDVELEGTAIDSLGVAYVLYNNFTTEKIDVYKVDYDKNIKVDITVPIETKNGNIKYDSSAVCYREREDEENVINIVGNDNKYSFSININDLGVYEYFIKQKENNSNIIYDKDPIIIAIDSRYSLVSNEVITNYQLSKNKFINSVNGEVIKVPDTFKNISIIYMIGGIIFIIVGSILLFIFLNKRNDFKNNN